METGCLPKRLVCAGDHSEQGQAKPRHHSQFRNSPAFPLSRFPLLQMKKAASAAVLRVLIAAGAWVCGSSPPQQPEISLCEALGASSAARLTLDRKQTGDSASPCEVTAGGSINAPRPLQIISNDFLPGALPEFRSVPQGGVGLSSCGGDQKERAGPHSPPGWQHWVRESP